MGYKKDDIVEIKLYDLMKSQYGTDSNEAFDEFIPCDGHFIQAMKPFCGKRVILTESNIKNEEGTAVRFMKGGFIFTQDMFTKVGELREFTKTKNDFYKKKYTKAEITAAQVEMLQMVDKEKFDKIMAGANGIDVKRIKGTTKMLQLWAENKVNYFLMFGRKLKIKKEIEIEMTADDVAEDVETLRKAYPLQVYILDLFQKNDIIKNCITNAPRYFKQYYDIQPGMKLTKAMHKIFENEQFDIELSKVVQKTKKSGSLVVSIDPVDILFMSKNNSGWHSCHNIYDEGGGHGCYAGGIFSYIEDKATLISYRCSDTIAEYNIGKYKVEDISKSWRELLFCNPDNFYFVASRQYPYDDELLTSQVRILLETQVSEYMNVPNKWTIIHDDNLARKVVRNESGKILHYNDVLLYTSKHYPILYNRSLTANMSPKEFTDLFSIVVGAESICPVCGEHLIRDCGWINCHNCGIGDDY